MRLSSELIVALRGRSARIEEPSMDEGQHVEQMI